MIDDLKMVRNFYVFVMTHTHQALKVLLSLFQKLIKIVSIQWEM